MDRQWRPSPRPVCPTCSISHLPFCPPPPPTTYYPQPFQGDHSFHTRPFPFPNWQPYQQQPNGSYLADGDRNFKRPRIDDDLNPPPINFSDDERRLKLIRDHGVALANPPQPQDLHHSYVGPVRPNQNGFRSDSGHDAFQNGQLKTSSYPYHGYGTSSLDPLQRVPDVYHAHTPHREMNVPYEQIQQPHDFGPFANAHEEGNQTQHKLNGRVVHYPYPYPTSGSNSFSESMGQMEASMFFRGQPPLPSSPPPPLPMDPPINQSSSQLNTYFSPPKKSHSLFPVPMSSSAVTPEAHPVPQQYFHSKPLPEFSAGFPPEEHLKQYLGDGQPFSLNQFSAEKPKFIDASHLFRHPHRASRPDHFVVIFRGLPGSGKSYLAKMLRNLEVENGGDAPRIHSMDDYFMTEVEKVEDNDASKSSSSGRNKKPVMKKVMEYCYEPEMEEAYRSSMLKAFKKTVEEGVFTFIIVDDRNLRVADFAQFWATAKRSGYEVYILEATYKDPVGCAARNVHGFTQEDIEKMAGQWEEAPSLYLKLDVKSLFHGDDLKESRIKEVDMDMEDDVSDALPAVQGSEDEKVVDPPVRDDASSLKDGKRWDAEGEHPTEVRELGKSKWSEDFGEDDIEKTEGMKGNINALSGLIHQYGKERKTVHWGDQVGKTGFSIGAARKVNALSLVIGPGAGYNLKSNPLPEEESPTRNNVEPKKHSIFEERIRAERESFKAVFDRRRQRIGGLDVEEE
ncbi:uncharacterized protein LOC133292228 [Gastrolobium bilobum]|uniref:uncharacterized protein LOC133292228 n=1 Tax=Gastrolobium bilobum TaxID=150636 RepID=UPI002AB098CA|nr:uncharacterized protein LOC133292228 [Gastrolobium bilobum]